MSAQPTWRNGPLPLSERGGRLDDAANAAPGQAFARLVKVPADGHLTAVVASVAQALSGTGAQEASKVARSAGFEPCCWKQRC